MSKLFSVRSAFDDPNQYPLSGTGILSWFRNTRDGVDNAVTILGAMRSAAVFRSVQIISQGVGTLPLRVYTTKDNQPVTTSVANKSYNQPFTQNELWSAVTQHLVTWGNAYVWKVRNPQGLITGLVPIHPSRVSVKAVNAEVIGQAWTKQFFIDGKPLGTTYEIMHIHIMSDDGLQGRGPLEFARTAVAIAVSAEQAAQRMYSNGLMINGLLSTELALDKTQADMLKARWAEKTAGIEHAGETAIMSHGLKFQQLTMNPADAQFLESRKFQKEEIACLFGLPPWMLGEVERSTGQGPGMSAQFTSMAKLTLKGYATAIEQKVSQEILPSTQDCFFDMNDLTRGDATERAAFYQVMTTLGAFTPNDVLKAENMPPVAWGDKPWLPNNTSADNPVQDGNGGQSKPQKNEPKDPGGEDDK